MSRVGSKNNTQVLYDGKESISGAGHVRRDGFNPDREKNKHKCKDCGKIFKKETGSNIIAEKFYSLLENISALAILQRPSSLLQRW